MTSIIKTLGLWVEEHEKRGLPAPATALEWGEGYLTIDRDDIYSPLAFSLKPEGAILDIFDWDGSVCRSMHSELGFPSVVFGHHKHTADLLTAIKQQRLGQLPGPRGRKGEATVPPLQGAS